MNARAAIVTGASSGIGLAIANVLGARGVGLTIAARRPEKLQAAAAGLRAEGYDVQQVAGNLMEERAVKNVVRVHEERYGRLDVLVNNAGVGIGEDAAQLTLKAIDRQLNTNLRSVFLFYREAMGMLRRAGEEHRNALVINTSSISGIRGDAWLSVYSATKHGIVGFTQAMNSELAEAGIKSTALCPAFVDTPMTEFLREQRSGEAMIQPADIAVAVGALLDMSAGCVVPEIRFESPNGDLRLPPKPYIAMPPSTGRTAPVT